MFDSVGYIVILKRLEVNLSCKRILKRDMREHDFAAPSMVRYGSKVIFCMQFSQFEPVPKGHGQKYLFHANIYFI